jgi:hypothetical protein
MTFVLLNAEDSSMRNRIFTSLAKLQPYVLIAPDEEIALALSKSAGQSIANLRAKICCGFSSKNLAFPMTELHSIRLNSLVIKAALVYPI